MRFILYIVSGVKKYRSSAVAAYAGQTAFFLVLSFFPFLMFFFSLLDLTPLSEQDFFMFMEGFVPSAFEETLVSFAHEIYAGSSGGRISITILTAVYLSSRAFLAMTQGMNSMYQVKESRNAIIIRIYSVLYSIVFAITLILVLAVMVFGKKLGNLIGMKIAFLVHAFNLIFRFRILICIALLFLVFWVMYYVLPNQKQRWLQQIPGAIFSAVGWMFLSVFFSLYVNSHSNYASFYGTMTTLAFLLLWLYGCMYILFLGGIINSTKMDVSDTL